MRRKITAILLALALMLTLAACGEKAEETTTLTGMVVSVEGTVITLMETGNLGSGERPEGMENFGNFAGFDPENFSGQLPEGVTIPENGQMPSFGDGQMPDFGGDGQMPELPEGVTIPEDGQMPGWGENGERPSFNGEDGTRPDMGSMMENVETKTVDIGSAHISVQEDGVKASGSLSDIKAGVTVTVTLDSKGNATNVLVTASSGFGGGRGNRS